MENQTYYTIEGRVDQERVSSRALEEQIQKAVSDGRRNLKVNAFGQHGIGGRLWRAGSEPVTVTISGHPGQRLGAMGFPNTFIEVLGPTSDDVGWLNTGAEIVVHGNAGNGIANAMAQGKVLVAGNIGARGMTMTKHNPRFEPPELWVLGSVGDYFGEFMAGGIAVICGFEPQDPGNILGYRPLVGMVGGRVFLRGPHAGYSRNDAKPLAISDTDWDWLESNLKLFLERIGRGGLFPELAVRDQWQLLAARTPAEKSGLSKKEMQAFREQVWEQELGQGGLVGDLIRVERTPVPLITNGDLRRFVPVWENRMYLAPCEAGCPTGVPVHERWRLIREGRVDEAVDLALAYTPFPATVCGYLCANLCMQACTRQSAAMTPVDVSLLGKASRDAKAPEFPPEKEMRVAVVGAGPAGLSVAWQLRRAGLGVTVYDMAKELGGKITALIPRSRIPEEVVGAEVERIKKAIHHVHLQQRLSRQDWEELKKDHDFIVIAVGAQKPRTLPVPGAERIITATRFLSQAHTDPLKPGKRVVVIGAGNVGCDVAVEAHRLGAEDITLIDVMPPASFGKERTAAEAIGAKFRWPCFTEAVTDEGVKLKSGELIPADTVFISIGDAPDLDFLLKEIETERGYVKVNPFHQTSDPQVFAVGDAVRPGLLTDAIGAGRKAAAAILDIAAQREPVLPQKGMIDTARVSLEYYDPRITRFEDVAECGAACASCGACRDCGICVEICPQGAIRKEERGPDGYEYVVDPERCIGCGFCAGACPCGVWNLVENTPLEA